MRKKKKKRKGPGMTDYFFFGLPTFPGAFSMSLYTSAGYRASLLIGMISSLWRICFIVSLLFPDFDAISATVKNSFPLINIKFSITKYLEKVTIISNNITRSDNILNKCIVGLEKYFTKSDKNTCIKSLVVILFR